MHSAFERRAIILSAGYGFIGHFPLQVANSKTATMLCLLHININIRENERMRPCKSVCIAACAAAITQIPRMPFSQLASATPGA